MKIRERIKQFQAERAEKVAALQAISEKALKEGRTKDASEQEQFDTLSQEIDVIDNELKDLRRLEKLSLKAATSPEDEDEDVEG
jgi:hypothetical protein